MKGSFLPRETVTLVAEIEADAPAAATLLLKCYELESLIGEQVVALHVSPGCQQVRLSWQSPNQSPRAYGLEASLLDAQGEARGQACSAVDVLERWTQSPRYGFLSDFNLQREDPTTTISSLARFHINALQFYDWQYRHQQLLPPEDQFVDPLGRSLSLSVVRSLIEAAHAHGMSTLAYLAIYAASLDFWREHPEWALYDQDGAPLQFFDFLGLMNPAPGGFWAAHLARECAAALQRMPFDGLHVDQYGDPKVAFDARGEQVDLPTAFAKFLRELDRAHPDASLLFNAVGNWPIEAVALAPTDAVYIEVWPPATRYSDLARIVQDAQRLSAGKPVIIALYQPADRPANILLADAVILACGGSRIELGENARLLADPYFPRHEALSSTLYRAVRRNYSFAVRYSRLLGAGSRPAEDVQATWPATVLGFPRRSQQWISVALVNLTGLNDPEWNQLHPAPQPLERVELQIAGTPAVNAVYWASPDSDCPGMKPVEWRVEKGIVRVALSRLEQWGIIGIQLRPPGA
ncbi:MAG: glycoside hydrolase family 66 protein [Chloroflexi bacterium]|nr:glycoside hydrolase family 66 protein [Chloroflexota bacterium]